jgi:hypothetical protein
MELRVGARARASKDYDTAFRDDMARLEDVLGAASVHVHGDFRLTAGAAAPIGPTGAVRIPVRIAFSRYDWGTIDLEVSAAEGARGPIPGPARDPSVNAEPGRVVPPHRMSRRVITVHEGRGPGSFQSRCLRCSRSRRRASGRRL